MIGRSSRWEELQELRSGLVSYAAIRHRRSAPWDPANKVKFVKQLKTGEDRVSTMSFNESGHILLSGSVDGIVKLWDLDTGEIKISHSLSLSDPDPNYKVFRAKFIPNDDHCSILTCTANGQVRHLQIREGGDVDTSLLGNHEGEATNLAIETGSSHILYTCGYDGIVRKVRHLQIREGGDVGTSLLGNHEGGATNLAIETGSSHIFYTCGYDGIVQKFDLRTKSATKLFTYQSDGIVKLNAITIDPRNPNILGVGGYNAAARVYDIRRDYQPMNYYPRARVGRENAVVTGLAFSDQSELLVSYYNDVVYLFSTDDQDPLVQAFNRINKSHLSRNTMCFFGANCEYVVGGSDCGKILVWTKRDGRLRLKEYVDEINCVESHPHSMLFASSESGGEVGNVIKIWSPEPVEIDPRPIRRPGTRPIRRPGRSAENDAVEDRDEFVGGFTAVY